MSTASMDAPDLQDIRALLRTQPAMVEVRGSGLGGLKRMLRKRAEPLSVAASAPATVRRADEPAPLVTKPASSWLLFAPEDLPLAPGPIRRISFGLADRKPEPPPEPAPDVAAPDPHAPIVVPRRRTEESTAIGDEEVMELRELLAERLPGLLAASTLKVPPPAAEPAPAKTDAAAEAVDPSAPVPTPDWSRRAICFTSERVEAIGEQAVLGDLYARLRTEHETLRTKLAALTTDAAPERDAA